MTAARPARVPRTVAPRRRRRAPEPATQLSLGIPSASRLVAMTQRRGHARSNVRRASAQASMTCSQLSSTMSICSSAIAVVSDSIAVSDARSASLSAVVTCCATSVESLIGARSTHPTREFTGDLRRCLAREARLATAARAREREQACAQQHAGDLSQLLAAPNEPGQMHWHLGRTGRRVVSSGFRHVVSRCGCENCRKKISASGRKPGRGRLRDSYSRRDPAC